MNKQKVLKEFSYKASRSSGAGGQHVNKVSSKAELRWNFLSSDALSSEEKHIAQDKLSLTNQGELILQCDETRSWHQNKEILRGRALQLLEESLHQNLPRKKSKIPRSAKLKRLKEKKKQAEKKSHRQKPRKDTFGE